MKTIDVTAHAGVYYRNASADGIVAAKKVSVVDTTGAGDSFVGGFLYRLSRDARGLDTGDADHQ